MTKQAQVAKTAPDTGQGNKHGVLRGLEALAVLKSHHIGEDLPPVVDTLALTPAVVETAVNAEVERERTPEEDAALLAELRALGGAEWAEGKQVVVANAEIAETDSVAGHEFADDEKVFESFAEIEPASRAAADVIVRQKPRAVLPKAPEGVSRDIGALFRPNVALGRYWFYVSCGGKCGTATLKVVRSRDGLDVLVVAVEGDVPEYLRDLRMAGRPIELEALIHPEELGEDEMSKKAKKLAEELAGIRRRMNRSRSHNRRSSRK